MYTVYVSVVRVGRYHKNGDGTVLKYYGITKYHNIEVYTFKLLWYLSSYLKCEWFPQVKYLSAWLHYGFLATSKPQKIN